MYSLKKKQILYQRSNQRLFLPKSSTGQTTPPRLTQTNIALFCKYVLKDESVLILLVPIVQGLFWGHEIGPILGVSKNANVVLFGLVTK